MRFIAGIPVDRARVRLTSTYTVTDRLSVGLEYNPLDDDLGPLANWRVLDETERRPALILGTSSDRIGTPRGRAVYGTFSKDLERWTGLPVAPYFGAAYGDFEEEWREIGGLRVRWSEGWSSTHLWDGVNLHHMLARQVDEKLSVGLLLVEQDGKFYAGFNASLSLGL